MNTGGPSNRVRVRGVESQFAAGEKPLEELRPAVEPWLSSVFQSERLSLLIGSGLTSAAAELCGAAAPSMASTGAFGELTDRINDLAKERAGKSNRGSANLEDQLTVALELIPGLVALEDARSGEVSEGILKSTQQLASQVLALERMVKSASTQDDAQGAEIRQIMQSFLLSFSSRVASRERLSVFTTNYDRIFEWFCDVAGVRLLDRFLGYVEPRFKTTRIDVDVHYNPPGIRGEPRYLEGVIRYAKLHGSIDWFQEGREVVRKNIPFGVEDELYPPIDSLLVFPQSAKDFETALFPYAELFRDFASSICRPNSSLVTYGYGFGDDHVNRVVEDMLGIPSTHLVIISWDEAGGRIASFLDRVGRPAQTSWLIGPDVASLRPLVEFLLPKPAIDSISEREKALLRRREPAGAPVEPTETAE